MMYDVDPMVDGHVQSSGFGKNFATGVVDLVSDIYSIGGSSARAQNQLNRDFQERMANTQWQRGVMDMKKAGINPLAAFTSAAGTVFPPVLVEPEDRRLVQSLGLLQILLVQVLVY